MPLLFQGHIDLLEEYLSRSRDQQVAFVQLIDQLIDAKTNIDVIVRWILVTLVLIKSFLVVLYNYQLQGDAVICVHLSSYLFPL